MFKLETNFAMLVSSLDKHLNYDWKKDGYKDFASVKIYLNKLSHQILEFNCRFYMTIGY